MAGSARFIVFEGGEGSGKSTQATLLAEALSATLTREPGGTVLGEAIREILLSMPGSIAPRAELLLMVGARAQHVEEVIRPTLSSGQHVVCERFSGSTLAYQGYGRGLSLFDVAAASALATDGLDADLTILLDVPPALAMSRLQRAPDRIEAAGLEFHKRVLEGYRALAGADPERWVVVDAARAIDEVHAEIRRVVSARFDLATPTAPA